MVDATHRSTRSTLIDGSYRLDGYALIVEHPKSGTRALAALYEQRSEAEEALSYFPANPLGMTARIVYVRARVQLQELREHDETESAEAEDERINRRGSAPDASPEERSALQRLK